jgi:hypothetical protein
MTTYGELKADVTTRWVRKDATVSQIEAAVRAGIRRSVSSLRVPSMLKLVSISPSTKDDFPIPADFLQTDFMAAQTGQTHSVPTLAPPDEVLKMVARPVQEGERPKVTQIGRFWHVRPYPSNLLLSYYADLPAMQYPEDMNSTLAACFDVFSYAALADLAVSFVDDRYQTFNQLFLERAADFNMRGIEERMTSGPSASTYPHPYLED